MAGAAGDLLSARALAREPSPVSRAGAQAQQAHRLIDSILCGQCARASSEHEAQLCAS
jgi:hypothetical protein